MGQSDFPTAFRPPSVGLARRTCLTHDLGFGLLPFPGFPWRGSLSAYRVDASRNRWDLSSSRRFSFPMPGARDPGRPSGISPSRNLRPMFVFSVCRLVSRRCHPISAIISTNDSSVLASVTLTTSPPALILLTGLNRFRAVQRPSGLGNALSTLHGSCSPVPQASPRQHRSASRARLDRGGWLALCPTGSFTLPETSSFA
jgi:hypothetical protein